MPYGMDRRDLGDRDDWTCWVCGGGVDPDAPRGSPHAASVDHVVPRARGGGSDPDNLRLAHRRCNGQRGSALPELRWPPDLGVIDPAPLWPVVQRARRRAGEWEVVAVVGEATAVAAQRWLHEAVTRVLGGGWETRRQPYGSGDLAILGLRTTPVDAPPRHRGARRRR